MVAGDWFCNLSPWCVLSRQRWKKTERIPVGPGWLCCCSRLTTEVIRSGDEPRRSPLNMESLPSEIMRILSQHHLIKATLTYSNAVPPAGVCRESLNPEEVYESVFGALRAAAELWPLWAWARVDIAGRGAEQTGAVFGLVACPFVLCSTVWRHTFTAQTRLYSDRLCQSESGRGPNWCWAGRGARMWALHRVWGNCCSML